MKKSTNSDAEQPPKDFAETQPRSSDMASYSAQVLFEMQHTLGKMESQLSNVDRSNNDIESRLRSIETRATWMTGFLACAVLLIPLCFGILWWSLGERIESALRINEAETHAPPAKPSP